jgi:hypothetical protein
MGDAFKEMILELENDETPGYVGSESFVGATGTLVVQWCKDVESLNSWASSNVRSYKGPWAKLG